MRSIIHSNLPGDVAASRDRVLIRVGRKAAFLFHYWAGLACEMTSCSLAPGIGFCVFEIGCASNPERLKRSSKVTSLSHIEASRNNRFRYTDGKLLVCSPVFFQPEFFADLGTIGL